MTLYFKEGMVADSKTGETIAIIKNENFGNVFAQSPEVLNILQKLVWKAKDQLHALKDPKCDYQENSEYITQLKEYITSAERFLK